MLSMPSAHVNDTRTPVYQALKGKIHQDLLNRLNLDLLTRTSRADAEPEIKGVIQSLLDRESQRVPLSLSERESLVSDVLSELFGLGPLEELLRDPSISDILVNRYSQVYIEREGKLEETPVVFRDDKHLMQIIERIVSAVGHRRRRVDADGRRAPSGRFARQRHHSSAGPRWSGHVDPPLSHRQTGRG
jgi:pilus assembly protein CpaF